MHGIKSPRPPPGKPPERPGRRLRNGAPVKPGKNDSPVAPSGGASSAGASGDEQVRSVSDHRPREPPPQSQPHGQRISLLGGLRSELIGAPLAMDVFEEGDSDAEGSSGLS